MAEPTGRIPLRHRTWPLVVVLAFIIGFVLPVSLTLADAVGDLIGRLHVMLLEAPPAVHVVGAVMACAGCVAMLATTKNRES